MKKPRPTKAQWAYARVADEVLGVPHGDIAGMLGVQTAAVRARAKREGWERREAALQLAEPPADVGDAAGNADDAGMGDAAPEGDSETRRREGGDPVEMLARMSGFVARQLERLIAAADKRGGKLDKSQIDGLTALSRMAERWEAVARERAAKERQKSDDKLAGTHGQVVDRLVRLAEAEAKRLVEEFLAAERDRGAGWRVVVDSQA